MLKRPNLPKFHCRELEIVFHVTLSKERAGRLLTGSHGHTHRGRPYSAVYGSIYSLNKVPHVARGYIRRAEKEFHVELRHLQDKWSKPPRGVEPFAKLLDMLSEKPQRVTFECSASFVYDQKSGFKSAIEMPMPLSGEEGERYFTHIEDITLSKQTDGLIQHSVQFGRTRSGDVRHSVFLLWEGEIAPEIPLQSLERASKISRFLLLRQDEGE